MNKYKQAWLATQDDLTSLALCVVKAAAYLLASCAILLVVAFIGFVFVTYTLPAIAGVVVLALGLLYYANLKTVETMQERHG